MDINLSTISQTQILWFFFGIFLSVSLLTFLRGYPLQNLMKPVRSEAKTKFSSGLKRGAGLNLISLPKELIAFDGEKVTQMSMILVIRTDLGMTKGKIAA